MKREKNSLNRDLVNAFIEQHWYTTTMIIWGKEIDMTKVDGFYFRDGQTGADKCVIELKW